MHCNCGSQAPLDCETSTRGYFEHTRPIRLELPRFSGQLRAVGTSTEVRDSRWK